MKKFTLILALVSALTSHAFDLGFFENEVCPRTIVPGRSPGFYSHRPALVFQDQGQITYLQKVTDRGETFFLLRTSVSTYPLRTELKMIRDFVMVGDRAWVVGDHELVEFNGRGREVARYRYNPNSTMHEMPQGLDLRGDELLIAHGSMGLISFNLLSRSLSFRHRANTLQENGLKSKAVGVTWEGHRAYLVLTGLQQGSFNGVVAIDLNSDEVVNNAAYKQQRWGVVDTQAKVYYHNGFIHLNNGGWIHSFPQAEILSKEYPRPRWRSIRTQHNGRNLFAQIRGDFIFDEGRITGCALLERTPAVVSLEL